MLIHASMIRIFIKNPFAKPSLRDFPFAHVWLLGSANNSEPHSQNRLFETFLLLMFGFSPNTFQKMCHLLQAG